MKMTSIVMVFAAFLSGSLPFSVWLGKVLVGKDVRHFGDGNPGAANAFRRGNKLAGILTLLLDVSKAAAPVGLAHFNLGMRGAGMFLMVISPILGHVFSPFLRFRGGKGLATALGVWIGLTIWKISLPAVLGALIGIALFTPPGWSVILALGGILLVLFVWLPNQLLLAIWLGETLLLAWTHRHDLSQGIHLRPWLVKWSVRMKGQSSG